MMLRCRHGIDMGQDSDAAYIDLRGGNEELALRQIFALTEPEGDEVILDVAPSGKFLGVEILGACRRSTQPSWRRSFGSTSHPRRGRSGRLGSRASKAEWRSRRAGCRGQIGAQRTLAQVAHARRHERMLERSLLTWLKRDPQR
jgi:uncharacterized protein YuzE